MLLQGAPAIAISSSIAQITIVIVISNRIVIVSSCPIFIVGVIAFLVFVVTGIVFAIGPL